MSIDSNTCSMGIIGNPLRHSLSPLIHNAILARMGMNYVYLPFVVSPHDLKAAVNGIRALGLKGVNVTIPFKERVIEFLDELSEEAQACGAVNLIKNHNGRLTGYNTDGKGFIRSILEEGVLLGGRVLMIGAGGAARAVAYELAASSAAISFLDIEESKASGLAHFISETKKCPASWDIMNQDNFSRLSRDAPIIINTSPLGMYPRIKESPVNSMEGIRPGTVVCDLIYNPNLTRFLQIAGKKGAKTIGGRGMFIYQAALTLEILLGIKAPIDYMKEVIDHQFDQ